MKKANVLAAIMMVFYGASGYCNQTLDVFSGPQSPKGEFRIAGCLIIYDINDFTTVAKSVEMLNEDIEMLTGKRPSVNATGNRINTNSIIIGTIGRSSIIDSLSKAGVIRTDDIKGETERFKINTVVDGEGNSCLVIAGSDRRGTAYGATTLSRELGVDPWVWWADVPVKFRPDISVTADYTSFAPSVRYRGIFINDEDWGMLPWAAQGLDKDKNDIGPKTYEKVCQLLLRLKGNMLAPAMHSCTGAFYSHPESKQTADDYGIIITTSHCEPMLFNNAAKSEWNPERDGIWDYGLNREVIYGKFKDRLDEAGEYENIYTIGMRGVHDEAMSRERPIKEKIEILERVIADQREILEKRLGKPASEIPQIFVPYKETLDLYRNGLRIPEDVTIVWPDDNYGYMKSLSTPAERQRKGGSGVYYHTSYLGTPHDYLWLCTTPPAFMHSELRKAYDTGTDRYWLLNVGDIKPAELDTQFFFDMAWDIDAFDEGNANTYQAGILSKWCGEEHRAEFQKILDEYYRLAWIRKPEYMGWEIEWDSPEKEDIRPTEFSFTNYGDAIKRIDDYADLATRMATLMSAMPDSVRAAVYETIGYSVMAANFMNRKFLFAQLNKEYSEAGSKDKANYAAYISNSSAEAIDSLSKIYNELYEGKWRGMMSIPPGFCAKYQEMPPLTLHKGIGAKAIWLTYDTGKSRCRTLNLKEAEIDDNARRSGTGIIEGFGYDGHVLRLGSATGNHDVIEIPQVTLRLEGLKGDSVTLQIFHLPYFPLHEGKGCRIGVSVDGSEEKTIEYLPEEWSAQWKENVLRNSALSKVSFKIDPDKEYSILRLRGLDPGMAIQRIVVDEGGLRPGYVGVDVE
ncbi:MAG: glycosyl hydrolase 115 family protein [Muribaculaceae bacterium]|nr:glycosyl hydrolase 115 family protein [Muribaculaceae bacterium]